MTRVLGDGNKGVGSLMEGNQNRKGDPEDQENEYHFSECI